MSIRVHLVLVALSILLVYGRSQTEAQETAVMLHVDGINGQDDSAPCVPDQIYRTIQAVADCALAFKKAGTPVDVLIQAGTYRESVNLWLNPAVHGDNQTPIAFMAAAGATHQVIVTGSELFSGWTAQGNGLYTLLIDTYPLSLSPQLPGGQPQMPDIVRYREMVFADGQHLTQVENGTSQSSGDGTFKVDRATGLVTIAPFGGVLNHPFVEVAVRDFAWKQNHVNNVTIEGLVFQHAASEWENGRSALSFAESDSLVFTNNRVQWNNGDGLLIAQFSHDVRIERTQMNHNGKSGIGSFRSYNLLVADSETNWNNWRGALGSYYGWWLGNKFTYSRGVHLLNHVSIGNESRGLWFDLDNEDMVIENATVADNRRDGIFLEVSQGPITIRNSRFEGNGEYGIRGANAEKVTLERVEIINNELEQLVLTADNGDGPRDLTNHETGELMTLWLKEWTIRQSVIGRDDGGDAALVRSSLLDDHVDELDWQIFLADFVAEGNCYFAGGGTAVFDLADPQQVNSPTDFAGWQMETGQEGNSTFQQAAELCAIAHVPQTSTPLTIDGAIEERWQTVPVYPLSKLLLGDALNGPEDVAAQFRLLYDQNYLYLLVQVTDDDLQQDSAEFWQDDNVEIFIDAGGEGDTSYDGNDFQLVFGANGRYSLGPNSAFDPSPVHAVQETAVGYTVEIAIPHTIGIQPQAGYRFGLDVHVTDDDDGGVRENKLSWRAQVDEAWRDPSLFGRAQLGEAEEGQMQAFLPLVIR
ncbi:MAG: sugar-binding protein [Chloroflexota bacterium]